MGNTNFVTLSHGENSQGIVLQNITLHKHLQLIIMVLQSTYLFATVSVYHIITHRVSWGKWISQGLGQILGGLGQFCMNGKQFKIKFLFFFPFLVICMKTAHWWQPRFHCREVSQEESSALVGAAHEAAQLFFCLANAMMYSSRRHCLINLH